MTRLRVAIFLLLILAVVGLPTAISARRMSLAQDQLHSAKDALFHTSREAQEIIDLRTRRQTVESRQRPAQDVIAQVNAVLAEVGIPLRHFSSLTPEAEATAAGSATAAVGVGGRLLQQSVRLVLQDLSPEQIGAFLIQWRSSQKIWTPSRIELTHARTEKDSRDTNRYDATITFTALYLADSPASPPSPTSTSMSLAKERP